MRFPTKETIECLKEEFPKGTRVRLHYSQENGHEFM